LPWITSIDATLEAAKQELTTVFEELEKQKENFKNWYMSLHENELTELLIAVRERTEGAR